MKPLAAVVLVAMAFSFTLANAQTDDLISAAKRGDLAVVNALLKSGADVNDRKLTFSDGLGNSTALMEASYYGHLDVVQALLAAKADVNATRPEKRDGETALMLAAHQGHVEVVQALLAAKANVDPPCCTTGALYYAALSRNVAMVKVLLTAKPDLNRGSKVGDTTALMWGISQGTTDSLAIARLLVEAGADVNLFTDKGVTALMLAVQRSGPDSLAMVQALLAAGAYVDSRRCGVPVLALQSTDHVGSYERAQGATALGVASLMGNTAAVQALLAAKADVNLARCDGSTPLTLALQNNHADVAEILRSAIAAAPAVK